MVTMHAKATSSMICVSGCNHMCVCVCVCVCVCARVCVYVHAHARAGFGGGGGGRPAALVRTGQLQYQAVLHHFHIEQAEEQLCRCSSPWIASK